MADRRVVVVGIDGSDHSIEALHRAVEEARLRDAELHIVHATDFTPAIIHLPDGGTVNTAELAEAGREGAWKRVEPHIPDEPKSERVDREGYPADVLVEYCAEVGADLLVLGTRGRGRLASSVLGSTSLSALARSDCDVLIAKQRSESSKG
jgi:nucleotide-binding universal stress UspA family protein